MSEGQAVSKCPGCAIQAARNAAWHQQVARWQAEVTQLHAQLKTLQIQLHQTSANLQRPPSSALPIRAQVRMRELRTRQRGGQPGHPGTSRQLRPAAEVEERHVAGEVGFTRIELGRYVQASAPAITRALQKLISPAYRQVVCLSSGRYRLTDLGSRRVRTSLAEKLPLQ